MKPVKAKIKAIGLVRNAEGVPQFSDPDNIPECFWELLTEKEKEDIKNGRKSLRSNS